MLKILCLVFCALLLSSCTVQEKKTISAKEELTPRFHRVFCWGRPTDEETARRYALSGVTDIPVSNQKQYDLAVKYGMTPYAACFTPGGPYIQKVTPEEEAFRRYIGGRDLDKKLPRKERDKIIHRRRLEKKYRYGGEKEVEMDVLNEGIHCFISDTDFSYSRKRLDKILKQAVPGVKGIYFDYIGYINHKGCYCKNCLEKLHAFLKKNNLKDTQANRDIFYGNELVKYYNKAVDYVKSKRPDFKIVAHLYPDFQSDPLFGNRLKVDYCGQTVAWYFKWKQEKIARYTRFVVERARENYSFVEGIPFLGISSSTTSSLGYKTPAELEKELQTILASGGRTLMICNGHVMVEKGYFEVFKKYCNPAGKLSGK
ncbi:MAG: hypothetical protein J6S53_07340 [Lentisphaeria bacterium]|nr:hypothetical protein [Lentisphaeria bacterium]